MAVVFISPRSRQKMFFLGIAGIFTIFMVVVVLIVFFSQPEEPSPALVFNKPKITIDLKVFDSEQFKNLAPFPAMQTQFSYIAENKDKQQEQGVLSASSENEARKILDSMGLKVKSIQEIKMGRENPFTPYYQNIVAPPSVSPVKKK